MLELEEMSQVHRLTRGIDGWLTELEGASLYHAAAYGPSKGQIVEIGSFKGKSTIYLAKDSRRLGRELVYTIDTHLGSPEHQIGGELASHMPAEGTTEFVFRKNLEEAGVSDYVVPLIMSSDEALAYWRDPIRLLFIDANHAYSAVKNDFQGWQKYLVEGGIVAFHDVDRWDGLKNLRGQQKLSMKMLEKQIYSPTRSLLII